MTAPAPSPSPASAPRRLVIVGGGVSGLSAARLAKSEAARRGLALDVLVLEAADRVGGVIATEERDGYLLEAGPDCFLSIKPAGLRLCRDLGIEGEVISTRPLHRRSFVLRRGRLAPVPEGFHLLAPGSLWALAKAPLFSVTGKMRMALDLFIRPRRGAVGVADDGEDDDESLGDFVRRRLGREALEGFAEPMAAGIYAADPDRLSMRATLPQFVEMERLHGSLIRGVGAHLLAARRGALRGHATGASGARYGLFVSFRRGMRTLVESLTGAVGAHGLRTGSRVTALTTSPAGGGYTLRLADGRAVDAEAVILALAAPAAARLLEGLAPEAARDLAATPTHAAATLNLGYRRDQVSHPLDGMGFVAPRREGRALLACSFSHEKFDGRAPPGQVLLRAFLGGARNPDVAERAEGALIADVRRDLSDLLGITGEPEVVSLRRHAVAMAQYEVGHLARVARVEAALGRHVGLALAGNGLRGVGVPDCIESGERAAARVVEEMESRRAP